MYKISASGRKSGIVMSLSNYVHERVNGYEGAKLTFKNTVNGQPFDADKICAALNRMPGKLYSFSVYRVSSEAIILLATDCFGYRDLIKIKEA